MAPSAVAAKSSKSEALWREAWVGSPYSGDVELVAAGGGKPERLVIRCEEVAAEHGADAEILDDGRTVGVAVGERVQFGVIERSGGRPPAAANVFRRREKRKVEEAGLWDEWGDSSFDYTAAATREDKQTIVEAAIEEFAGIVRNRSRASGNFWIECPKVHDAYNGRDAMVKTEDMPLELGVGDAIVFTIEVPKTEKHAPLCRNIKRAPQAIAEALLTRGLRDEKGGKGCGKGKDGKGNKSKPGGLSNEGIASIRARANVMRMTGIVKRPSLNTGRFFVFCQDISDVYGKDCQIPPEELPEGVELKLGDRISFDVEELTDIRGGTPWARNIVMLTKGGDNARRAVRADDGEDDEDIEIMPEEPEEEAKAGAADDADWLDDEAGEVEDEKLRKAVSLAEDEAEASALSARKGTARFGKKVKKVIEAEEEDEWPEGEDEAPAPKPKSAKPTTRFGKKPKTKEAQEAEAAAEPTSVDEWIKEQSRIFGHLSTLPKGWIRIRSKSKGLVYFYNTKTGASSPTEPMA